MKLFWLIIVLFIAAAGFVVYSQWRSNDPLPQSPDESTSQASDEQLAYESPLFAQVPDDEPVGDERVDDAEAAPADDESVARELAEDLLASSQGSRDDDSGDPIADNWPTSAGGGGGHQHQAITQFENPWAVEGEMPLGDERMASQRLQHSVVEQDDGSLLLDDTFVLRGKGTAASPYEITWDLLMSAAETYQPRLGMENIPERVALLDGKYVKISGHLMFPMITGQANELLVMLNMWDGCCIGTMPSPYDAVEVQLATPAAVSNQQFFNYGTIEGTLSIDPYLINDWLIGLYLMEDAKLNVGM